MKVIENTSERLVLRVIPFGTFLVLGGTALLIALWGAALLNAGQAAGGLALIGFGVLFFVVCLGAFVKAAWIRIDRALNRAEVIERGLFGSSRKDFRLDEINGATLQSMVIKRRAGDLASERQSYRKRAPERRVWRVAFARGNNPPLPLTEVYGSERTARAIGSAINAWFGSRPS